MMEPKFKTTHETHFKFTGECEIMEELSKVYTVENTYSDETVYGNMIKFGSTFGDVNTTFTVNTVPNFVPGTVFVLICITGPWVAVMEILKTIQIIMNRCGCELEYY